VLGIDPGSRITGFGIIDTDGRQSRHVASGCIATPAGDFTVRLGAIFGGVAELVERHRPAEVAVEQVFMARNASSALKLGQARGAAISAVVNAGLPVYEYTPRAVKQAVVGTGGAEKPQVAHMVAVLLNYREHLAADQADALAVALCHAHASAGRAALASGGQR
jgi:crossover junction endodeoxyribonuclease RuvC